MKTSKSYNWDNFASLNLSKRGRNQQSLTSFVLFTKYHGRRKLQTVTSRRQISGYNQIKMTFITAQVKMMWLMTQARRILAAVKKTGDLQFSLLIFSKIKQL